MGERWMPGAQRDSRAWRCNSMHRNTKARRMVLHWTASPAGASPQSQADYIWRNAGAGTGYHLIFSADQRFRPLQLRPADCAAGSLLNNGSLARSPNREGTVCIQVAVIGGLGDYDEPFRGDGPGFWWPRILEWADGWDIPRSYVHGNWTQPGLMPRSVWYSGASGYTAHRQVPETSTVRKPDPGPVDDKILWAGGAAGPATVTLDTEGGGTVTLQLLKVRKDPIVSRDVRSVQFLVESHRIDSLPVGGLEKNSRYDTVTADAVRVFQKAKGLTADGICGEKTWRALLEG